MRRYFAFILILLIGCMTSHPDTPVSITFQPMQCEESIWSVWYDEGNIQFIKAPSDAELITAYYSSLGIELSDVQQIQGSRMVCQACSVCPVSYHFTAIVKQDQAQQMLDSGWTKG